MSALLGFVKFYELSNWSVAHILQSSFIYSKKYRIVKLKEFLTTTKMEWVDIKDEQEYPILGIRGQGQGVYINRVSLGKELTMKKYQKSKKYHLFYCKVRTVKGQWGIVYPEFENSYGSSNMQYLKINLEKIVPEYIELLLKLKKITDEWDKFAIGADGRHFPLKTLLNLTIPLPSLDIQKQIVENYQAKINLANEQEQKAKELEKEIEVYLYRELGLNTTSEQTSQLLNFVQSSHLSRWDICFLRDNNIAHSKYDLVPLNSIVNKFLKNTDNSSLRFDSSKYPELKFNYIGMENIEKESGKLLKLDEVNGSEVKSQTIKLPKGFFLYGKLRPYLNKYFLNDLEFDNIIVSSEFFVFSVKNINEQYFKYILSSSFIQAQIENHMKGARMPRISEETFRSLLIPLPSLEIQNNIATNIQTLKNEIQSLHQQSEQNRTFALAEFEKEVFNEA